MSSSSSPSSESETDNTSLCPSGPNFQFNPNIFPDLLIFEESLRQRYKTLQARKRRYTVFFTLLLGWCFAFGYLVLFEPCSNYYLSLLCHLSLISGLLTLSIYYLSGLYHSTLVAPRKFIPQTNRSLRQFHFKIIKNPRHRWWDFRRRSLAERQLMIVLSAKVFSAEIREGWETYRREYWENEEVRRRVIRRNIGDKKQAVGSKKGSRRKKV